MPASRGQAASAPKASDGPDFKSMGLSEPVFDLQSTSNVGDRMSQYYKDFAELQKFAKTMWKNYGIDVQAPDPSNPLAVRSAETFAEMISNLWETQNLAKNSEADRKKLYDAQLQGRVEQVNPFQQGQFLNQINPNQQFSTNEVPPWLANAGASTGETVDNTRDYKRKLDEWQVLHDEVKRRLDINPNNPDMQKNYQVVLTMKPSFNTEATKDSTKGKTFIDTGLEELALMSKGSNKYFTPTDKFDANGGRILRSDKFKGKTIGRRDINTKSGAKQVGFVVDHIEYRPGEGGMVFVDVNNNIHPVSELGIIETYAALSDVPKTQLYKHIGERYGTDQVDAMSMISPENMPTLAKDDELMAEAPKAIEQRQKGAEVISKGKPIPWTFGLFTSDLVATGPNGEEIELNRPLTDNSIIKFISTDWSKLAPGGTITVGDQVIDKSKATKGLPKELAYRILELRGFKVPGMEGTSTIPTTQIYEPKSQAEYEAIPSGSKYRNYKTGTIQIKP